MPVRRDVAPEQLDPAFLNHLRRLGISGVKQYRQWCTSQGFSPGINKHHTLREAEVEAIHAKSALSVERKRGELRHPITTLLAIASGNLQRNKIQHSVFRRFHTCVRSAGRRRDPSAGSDPLLKQQVLVTLLERMAELRVRFLDKNRFAKQDELETQQRLETLVRISQYRQSWVRPLHEWKPRSRSARRQFTSLIRHLFDRYGDVPAFMDSVWLSAEPQSMQHRQWYVQLGARKNLRHCDLPIPYTKRMAHWFYHCPEGSTVSQAIRFGQVMGLGGDNRTALAINGTQLADDFEHDEFWITFIRWLIAHPMLDRSHVGPIVDYIRFQRFVPEYVMVRDQQPGIQQQGQAREPNFSMKGRTPETLLRQVNRWHGRLRSSNVVQMRSWTPSYIQPFSLREGAGANVDPGAKFKQWTIRELLSSTALVAEGRKLGHCVASYAHSCASGHSSIWTMEMQNHAGLSKLLTIEVHLKSRTIVQVRGKGNRLPVRQEIEIIQRWASVASLKINAYGMTGH